MFYLYILIISIEVENRLITFNMVWSKYQLSLRKVQWNHDQVESEIYQV